MLKVNHVARLITLLLIILYVMVWPCAAHGRNAQQFEYRIVTGDDSETTDRIVKDLRGKYPSAQILAGEAKRNPSNKKTIFIAIGPAALRQLLTPSLNGVVISTFTSSQAYHSIVDNLPASPAAAVTAVYAEPSPLVQLRLISMLHKKPVRVAVILSTKTAYLKPILQRAASQIRTEITIEQFSSEENLNRVLNRLADIPVILAIPDSTVYNAENIRNILVTTYRRNQPVIGFSAPLVKAGALASTYSNIEDITAQVEEVVNEFEATGKLIDPQFPKYFSAVVNEDVARSLDIVVDESVKEFARKPVRTRP